MAGDWIKVEKATARKPEVLAIADALNVHVDHAFGLCVRFWSWCDDQMSDGHACSVTNVTLDAAFGHVGFASALVKVGWLRVRDGSLEVPNFDRHLSESAKNRALSGRRKRKERAANVTLLSRCERDKSVTREEKRREEDIKHTLTHGEAADEIQKLVLPITADSARNREWLEKWQAARKAQHGSRTSVISWQAELIKLSHWSEQKWHDSLVLSAAKASKSIIDADNDFSKHRRQPQAVGAGQVHSGERVKNVGEL